jgi:ActR/RegA family two-component response regulator
MNNDQQPTTAAPDVTGPAKKILLVEDDDALANTYVMRLEAEGFHCQARQ